MGQVIDLEAARQRRNLAAARQRLWGDEWLSTLEQAARDQAATAMTPEAMRRRWGPLPTAPALSFGTWIRGAARHPLGDRRGPGGVVGRSEAWHLASGEWQEDRRWRHRMARALCGSRGVVQDKAPGSGAAYFYVEVAEPVPDGSICSRCVTIAAAGPRDVNLEDRWLGVQLVDHDPSA